MRKKAAISKSDLINRTVERYRAVVMGMDIYGQRREQFEYGDTPEEAYEAIKPHVVEFCAAELEAVTVLVRATYEDEYEDTCRGYEKTVFPMRRRTRDSAAIWMLRVKPEDMVDQADDKAKTNAKYLHSIASELYKKIAAGVRRRVVAVVESKP